MVVMHLMGKSSTQGCHLGGSGFASLGAGAEGFPP